MKKIMVILVLVTAGFFLMPFDSASHQAKPPFRNDDSLAMERKKFIAAIIDSLKEKAALPADSVFSNLQLFDQFHRLKVRHLLGVMDYWGESLNVGCNYCHTPGKWASDDLRTKRIARDMFTMRSTINQALSKINDLKSKPATINCMTCHNGKTRPPSD